jgi:ribonuclease D
MSVASPSEQLARFLDRAHTSGHLAIDTEFMGEGRYRTLLCLIQLAVPELAGYDEEIALFDPLDEQLDLSPLAEALVDPGVQIVVHAGRQDIALLRRALDCEVTNLLDTQIAAGFAGLGAQSSYDSLLGDVLGLRLAKSASFTRWDARPLSAEQTRYAREDVLHLLELAEALEAKLRSLGRLDWALQECEPLTRASDRRDPQTIFERLPRVGGLSGPSRLVARELVAWREQTAERQDRPIQSVLGDAGLVEIARRKPRTRDDLGKIRGVGGSASGRRAQELLDVIKRAASLPEEALTQTSRPPSPKSEDLPIVALIEALVRTRAREAGLAYELLASKADLQAIVTSARLGEEPPDVRTLRGWRGELVGAELLELLAGGISLSVGNEQEGRQVRIEQRD